MHHRLLRLERHAPVPAAWRVLKRTADSAASHDGGWMSDIPRHHPDLASAGLSPERKVLIRERVASGFYHSAGYADDIARRILASGHL